MAKRVKVPDSVATEVMFSADLCCCICEKRGAHLHHVDENPTNNDFDNLVLLCFEHHHEVTAKGGLARKLSPDLLSRYRAEWYARVEQRRNSLRDAATPDREEGDERIFQLILDALAIWQIKEIAQSLHGREWEGADSDLARLHVYTDGTGVRARWQLLSTLDDVANRTRFKMPVSIAEQIARLTADALPMESLRRKAERNLSAAELELFDYGVEIGRSLAYDGAIKLGSLRIAETGGEVLWKIFQFARVNGYADLQELAAETLMWIESDERLAGTDFELLFRTQREYVPDEFGGYPEYPDRLVNKMLQELRTYPE